MVIVFVVLGHAVVILVVEGHALRSYELYRRRGLQSDASQSLLEPSRLNRRILVVLSALLFLPSSSYSCATSFVAAFSA